MLDLEPLVRSLCVKALDALVGRVEFDVIGEFGVEVPLRTIGFLFGIPEADQLAYRQRTDEALTTDGTRSRSISLRSSKPRCAWVLRTEKSGFVRRREGSPAASGASVWTDKPELSVYTDSHGC